MLAEIKQYSDLHIALRARAEELNLSRKSIESMAGLAAGHAGKLLAPYPIRALGRTTLGPVLYALGVKLLMVVDQEALADPRLDVDRVPRDAAKARGAGSALASVANQPEFRTLSRKILRKTMSKLGKKGGKRAGETRMTAVSASTRRRVARIAAKKRWSTPQVTEITTPSRRPDRS